MTILSRGKHKNRNSIVNSFCGISVGQSHNFDSVTASVVLLETPGKDITTADMKLGVRGGKNVLHSMG